MSQGAMKKKGWTMGREFLQYKTHGKSQQNKRQTLTKTNTTQFEDFNNKILLQQ